MVVAVYSHVSVWDRANGNRRDTYEVAAMLLASPRVLLLQAKAVHVLLQGLRAWRAASFKLAESDATVLVLGRHLLPLFNLWHASLAHGVMRIRDDGARRHVANFNEGYRNQTRTAKSTDRLGDEPLGVRLRNYYYGLPGTSLQLVSTLGLEVIHHDTVDPSPLLAGRFGIALAVRTCHRWGGRSRAAGVSIARIVLGILETRRGGHFGAIALRSP